MAAEDLRNAKDYQAAFLLAERACASRVGSACTSGAMILYRMRMGPIANIEELLREGCGLDDGLACANLFVLSRMVTPALHLAVEEVNGFADKAKRLLRSECERGGLDACEAFVGYYVPDEERLAFARMGCAARSLQLCEEVLLEEDPAHLDDFKKAAAMVTCFCDHENAEACATLARQVVAMENKRKVDALYSSDVFDRAAGRAVLNELRPACAGTRPAPFACYVLSLALRRGAGTPVNVVEADRMLAIACRIEPDLCSATPK
jgi:hypothetical protein